MSADDEYPKRPGVSEHTLRAAGIRFSNYPEPGSIEIPYPTPDGDLSDFKRWRLNTINGDRKYHQEKGTKVYVYYPPFCFRKNGEHKFGLTAADIFLVEGEFKTLSLLEYGIWALGIPSFTVYSRDESGNRRLLRDLQVTLGKEKPSTIYFLGDNDTCTNFEFSRNAEFLASAVNPAKVLLPRIPMTHPKGIDDCREALGLEFDAFFAELLKTAIKLPTKISAPRIALILLERETDALKALSGLAREEQFDRLVKLCSAAQYYDKSQATVRICNLVCEIIGLTSTQLKNAIKDQWAKDAKERKSEKTESQQEAKKKTSKDSEKPRVDLILPGHGVEINDCGRDCFLVLAKTQRYFVRDRVVFQLSTSRDSARLVQVEPDAFCSQLENYFTLLSYLRIHGNLELVRRCCSTSDATKLLKCDPALEILPPIALVTSSPVFIERNGNLIVLGKGYHRELGGIYVSRNYEMSDVPLSVAVAVIKSLADDFLFVAESDRSRFLSGFLAPALRFGELIIADFPLFVNEADKSQTGKTYAHKVLCQLYNERPFTVTLNNERNALGSHDEKLSKGLIDARPFIMWENARGLVDSQLAESALRGTGSVTCRIPYMAPIEVPTTKTIWLLSSNKAAATDDLAERSLISRMRKQPDSYQFKVFGDGRDLLQEVAHKCPYYLSCVLAIIREWMTKGRPRTTERRHAFTEVCQSLDWIVQNILKCAPLLDDHENEQHRVSNPLINWVRDVAITVEKNEKLDEWLRASEISTMCVDHDIQIPQCHADSDDKTRNQTVGRILKNIFKNAQVVAVSGFTVERQVFDEYDLHLQKNKEVTRHRFNK